MSSTQTTQVMTADNGKDLSERELRVQLAAAYRIFEHFGWCED